ncbi:HNH endonuclease [Streptomyces sp. NPDC057499]|uniref:HNH endonuclease n=1 Tax=Streptomyces sp. NPDC057499 TaxID=3346150 RepID=UPI0036C86928
MRCIDCTEPATHRGRCKAHHGAFEGRPNVRSRRARGRRRANRRDAAARLRQRVQERGSAWCDWCLGDFPADGVDVDHVRPLSMGGTDTEDNVQVLCRGCHALKTSTEFGPLALRPPRECCPSGSGGQGDEPWRDALDGQVNPS